MKILGKIINKKLALSDYNRRTWNDYTNNPENDGRIIAIMDRVPESRQQRKFLHGAIFPLWLFLNGLDHRDSHNLDWIYETAKQEFNGEIVILDGKPVKRGKSTKGLLAENDLPESGFIEKIINYLEENYGIDRNKVLNHEHYKQFRDEIYSTSEYDDYIQYLQEIGLLSKKNENN